MRTLYPDAEAFLGEEPAATRMVLTAVAIEGLADEVKTEVGDDDFLRAWDQTEKQMGR